MKGLKIVAVALSIVIIMLVCGCGKQLTRAAAERALNATNLCTLRNIPLRVNMIDDIYIINPQSDDHFFMSNISGNAIAIKKLYKEGVISTDSGPWNDDGYFNLDPHIILDIGGIGIKDGILTVVIFRYKNYKVDGIRKISDTECIVHANHDNIRTAGGIILGATDEPNDGTYNFQLYDDGWRLVSNN